MHWDLRRPPLFEVLDGARNILIAGAGGGFDVYAGLPLAFALATGDTRVHLANASFSALDELDIGDWTMPGLAAVTPDSKGSDVYFPERVLARWLAAGDGAIAPVVHTFDRQGVRPLRAAYRRLVETLDLDAIVLVDGGTDILMRGDEAGLGTPGEDMTSLAAVAGLDVARMVVVSAGFGVDAYHGVCHSHVLENLAALTRDGAYLGALSIPWQSPEGAAYLDAVAYAQEHTPKYPSIVNGQIAAAIRGEFGDVRFTTRTGGSELYVSPLMAMYLSVDLRGLHRRLLYRAALESTATPAHVALAIENFREVVTIRARRGYPH
jgi:hypothetical protein